MAMGRPKAALVLTPEQREQLESLASSRSLPAGLVMRARIILLSASGKTNLQIARQMGLTNATVGKWRQRFLEQDVSGLHDEMIWVSSSLPLKCSSIKARMTKQLNWPIPH